MDSKPAAVEAGCESAGRGGAFPGFAAGGPRPRSRARAGHRPASRALDGDPTRIVYEHAQQHGFDLLILGRHGTGGELHPGSAMRRRHPRLPGTGRA